MQKQSLIPVGVSSIIVPSVASKDTLSRLRRFATWMDDAGRDWFQPDLEAYREYLLQFLFPSSVQAHLSTIRARYRQIMRNRDLFYANVGAGLSPSDAKAMVDEIITRLENSIDPDGLPVNVVVKQDRADSEHVRLTHEQVEDLICAPAAKYGKQSPKALRDASLIALMLATGIREDECCQLLVNDLDQKLDGKLALMVRHGKGNKQRLIPYGSNWYVLGLVKKWLKVAGVEEGHVFRSFDARDRDTASISEKSFTPRTLQNILKEYPILIDGFLRAVRPHDLRRTYARREYEAGTTLPAIQQNLGHSSIETTMRYVGTLDAQARQGRASYQWNRMVNETYGQE